MYTIFCYTRLSNSCHDHIGVRASSSDEALRLWAKDGWVVDDPDGYVCPFCERERAKGTVPGQ